MDVVRIPVAEIYDLGGRTVEAATVAMLRDSLAAVGLMSPITVARRVREGGENKIEFYKIIAGRHRTQAARELGWREIDAVVVDLDVQHAELCEIDENLIRAELTDSQRARAHARRAELMAEMGLVREHGGDRKSTRQNADLKSYASAAAETLRVHPDTVRRDLARGNNITPEVLTAVEGTDLDKGVVLDQLAATPQADQPAKLIAIRESRAAAERDRKDAAKANRALDRSIAQTNEAQFAAWLLARAEGAEIAQLIAWIEAVKPRGVIAALRRGIQ